MLAVCIGVFLQILCWPKGTLLECAESIYVKITETACVSDELCRLRRRRSTNRECIKRVRDNIAFLSMLTVRVVVLEYNQLHTS